MKSIVGVILGVSSLAVPVAAWAEEVAAEQAPEAGGAAQESPEAGESDSAVNKRHPGFGLALMVGTNSMYTSVSPDSTTKPGFGFNFGLRADGYVTRFVSVETGASWLSRSFVQKASITSGGTTASGEVTSTFHSWQLPLQIKVWPIPYVFVGGGVAYTRNSGDVGCSADGSLRCLSSGVEYSKTGLKANHLDWIASAGFKARLRGTRWWFTGTFELIGSPNLVENSTLAGVTSFKSVDFVSYGGIRYGIGAE